MVSFDFNIFIYIYNIQYLVSVTFLFVFIAGAHVEVLEEALLCQPEELVAFKVKIIHDYYFACSVDDQDNCTSQNPVNSTIYIITDDDVKNCTKQCIRPELELGKEYFVMGTGREYDGLGHVWKLSGQKRTGGCVIYPWANISKKKANKLSKWTNEHYKCIDDE